MEPDRGDAGEPTMGGLTAVWGKGIPRGKPVCIHNEQNETCFLRHVHEQALDFPDRGRPGVRPRVRRRADAARAQMHPHQLLQQTSSKPEAPPPYTNHQPLKITHFQRVSVLVIRGVLCEVPQQGSVLRGSGWSVPCVSIQHFN